MANTWALVPAAGSGSRMGGKRKQYRQLGNRPVLHQTVGALAGHPQIGHVVVGCPEEDVVDLEEELAHQHADAEIICVSGGASRQETVRLLLQACDAPDGAVVLVHDAVRPFVSARLITRVIKGAREHGAAAPAIQVRDTLRRVQGDRWFGPIVDRSSMVRMQTPQGFKVGLLREAHEQASAEQATDDVALVQQMSHRVLRVAGLALTFKLTTPDDWEMAQAIWPWWCDQQADEPQAA